VILERLFVAAGQMGRFSMGNIIEINGPIVTVRLPGVRNSEQVRVGELLPGFGVISLDGETAVVQVYESTESLKPGQVAEALDRPLSVASGLGCSARLRRCRPVAGDREALRRLRARDW